jgi:gliding motility-associated-like protein
MVTITSSYSYNNFVWTWNNDTATGIEIEDYPESSTWYYIEATDYLGCKGVDSVYVVVGPIPYDAISPNGDGKNDEWEILDIASYPLADIQIFNRWGSLIFISTGENYNNNKWNGEHEGKLLPVGTYYYTINLKDGSELQTGAVTIVR